MKLNPTQEEIISTQKAALDELHPAARSVAYAVILSLADAFSLLKTDERKLLIKFAIEYDVMIEELNASQRTT